MTRRRRAAPRATAAVGSVALLALGGAVLGGCVRLNYAVRHVQEPIADAQLEALRPGVDDLGSCLRALGAPNFVWEYDIEGAALGWVFEDSAGWGLSISYSVNEFSSVSFSYDDEGRDLPGVVLWFDADLELLEWRRGTMSELAPSGRQRAAPVQQVYGDG